MQEPVATCGTPAPAPLFRRALAFCACRHDLLLSLLVALCLATALVSRELTNAASTLLGLAAIVALLHPRWRGRALPGEGPLHFAFLGFVAVALLLYLLVGGTDDAQDKLARYARFLLFSPVLMLFARHRLAPWALWWGTACGSLLAGADAVHEAIRIEHGSLQLAARASGESYAILFGDLSLALGVMSLGGLRWFRSRGRLWALVPLLAALAGLVASILSGTRGGWIALPAMALLLLWAYWSELSRRTRVLTLAALVLVPAGSWWLPGVSERVGLAVTEAHAYMDGKRESTSTGLRLEMWRVAWGLFRAHPLAGSGLGGYYPEVERQIAAGRLDPALEAYRQPHNEYLHTLATRGLIGMAALLALFLAPARLFWRALGRGGQAKDLGVAGLIFVIGYLHFGLTESVFDRALFISSYLFVVAVVAGLTLRALASPDGEKRD